MGAEAITRYDDHLVWEIRDGNDAVVVSVAVRTHDGDTVALTRDGSLASRDDTVLVMEVAGVDPQSIVAVNDDEFVADAFGRVSLSIDNEPRVDIVLVNDSVETHTSFVTQIPTSQPFIDTPVASIAFVIAACVVALCVPTHRQRRLSGVPT